MTSPTKVRRIEAESACSSRTSSVLGRQIQRIKGKALRSREEGRTLGGRSGKRAEKTGLESFPRGQRRHRAARRPSGTWVGCLRFHRSTDRNLGYLHASLTLFNVLLRAAGKRICGKFVVHAPDVPRIVRVHHEGADNAPPAQMLAALPADDWPMTNWYKQTVYDPGGNKIGEIA